MDAIAPSPTDRFIEIGPGTGALTLRLAPRVSRLTAIEVDRDLAGRLTSTVPDNTRVVVGDVLHQDIAAFATEGPLRVAGNLPYNIASPILFAILNAVRTGSPIQDATLMLQMEMAERLVAPVGTHEYGVLTILIGLRAEVRNLLTLPPGAFRPMPKVRSALVRVTFTAPTVPVVDDQLFERLVRSIFMHRRKMMGNTLKPLADEMRFDASRALDAARIDARRRPETLQLAELADLVAVVNAARHRAML